MSIHVNDVLEHQMNLLALHRPDVRGLVSARKTLLKACQYLRWGEVDRARDRLEAACEAISARIGNCKTTEERAVVQQFYNATRALFQATKMYANVFSHAGSLAKYQQEARDDIDRRLGPRSV